jgi:hypothetical protein
MEIMPDVYSSGVGDIQPAFDRINVGADTGYHGIVPQSVALQGNEKVPDSFELFGRQRPVSGFRIVLFKIRPAGGNLLLVSSSNAGAD